MCAAVESSRQQSSVLAVRQALCVQFVRMGVAPTDEMWSRAGLHSIALRRMCLQAELGGEVVAAAMAGRSADRATPEL